MTTADKIALASTIVAIIATLIAVPSVLYARVAARAATDSALTGRLSAAASQESAEASRRSAEEAAKITVIETARRAEERQRLHDDLGPKPPGEIAAELHKGSATDSLFGSITVPRGYRVIADALYVSGGSTRVALTSIIHPNRREDFQIEPWPPGSKHPVTKEIKFRFWPPLEVDNLDTWTCPCGRPTGESMNGPGHWEWTVPVSYTRSKGGRVVGL